MILAGSGCDFWSNPLPPPAQLIQNAGGLVTFSNETTKAFVYFSTNDSDTVSRLHKTNFPALFSFANSIVCERSISGTPRLLKLRYGSHSNTKFIYVCAPGTTVEEFRKTNWVEISSTIFTTK